VAAWYEQTSLIILTTLFVSSFYLYRNPLKKKEYYKAEIVQKNSIPFKAKDVP
jgi:hypothetical protein